MIMIGIAGLLLSLAAGMFLLAKTQKDNLGMLFKVISWFIILCSLGAILCGAVRCVAHGCCKKENKECRGGMMRDGGCDERAGGCEFGPRHFNKQMMIMKECEGNEEMECEEKCQGEEKGECKKDGMCKMGAEKKDCCKKMEIKKDSVVIKH